MEKKRVGIVGADPDPTKRPKLKEPEPGLAIFERGYLKEEEEKVRKRLEQQRKELEALKAKEQAQKQRVVETTERQLDQTIRALRNCETNLKQEIRFRNLERKQMVKKIHEILDSDLDVNSKFNSFREIAREFAKQ